MNTAMIEKIRARCAEVGDCWIWQQATSSTGYPIIRLNRTCQLVRRVVAVAGLRVHSVNTWIVRTLPLQNQYPTTTTP